MPTVEDAAEQGPAIHYDMSPTIGKIALALCKAQGEITPPHKDKTVKGRTYDFKYASLDAVHDALRKPLLKHEIAVFAGPCVHEKIKGPAFSTMLIHSSGEWLRSVAGLYVSELSSTAFGTAVTYMRRYQLISATNICADEDLDGAAPEPAAGSKPPKASAGRAVRGAPSGAFSEGTGTVLPPYGPCPGARIDTVSAEDLQKYAEMTEHSISNPEKKNFLAKNNALLSAIEAQLTVLDNSQLTPGESFTQAVHALKAGTVVDGVLMEWKLDGLADVQPEDQQAFLDAVKGMAAKGKKA